MKNTITPEVADEFKKFLELLYMNSTLKSVLIAMFDAKTSSEHVADSGNMADLLESQAKVIQKQKEEIGHLNLAIERTEKLFKKMSNDNYDLECEVKQQKAEIAELKKSNERLLNKKQTELFEVKCGDFSLYADYESQDEPIYFTQKDLKPAKSIPAGEVLQMFIKMHFRTGEKAEEKAILCDICINNNCQSRSHKYVLEGCTGFKKSPD